MESGGNARIKPQLAVLFVLLLGALVALPLYLFHSYEEATVWVAHTSAVRLAIQQSEGALVEAESAQRGYLITGEPGYLDTYRHAIAQLPERLARLRTLTRDDPTQQHLLVEAEALVDERVAHLQRLIEQRLVGRPVTLESMREGRQQTEAVDRRFQSMESEELQLTERRAARARLANRVALLFTVLVSMALAGVAAAIWLQRQARRRAEGDRARFYSLLMQTPVPIAVFEGPEHRFELVNAASREALAIDDLDGRPLFEVFPALRGGAVERLLERVARTGEPRSLVEHDLPTWQEGGGQPRRVFTSVFRPLRDEAGRIFAVMSVSIEVTEELAARRKIEAAVRLRDEFLSIASHELRTPLTTLRLQTDSLARAAGRGASIAPEQLLRKLGTMQSGVERLEQLVTQLLDVTRIERGRLALQPEEVDLTALAREAVERHTTQFARLHRALTLHAGEPIVGHWDRLRIDQVLTNLLTNALKYGGDQPVEVEVAARGGVARLEVIDHGIGIAAEDQGRIFERFERAVDERHFGGLGLGLYISRRIIEAHQGAIHVASAPGEGARFTVELPLSAG